MTAGDPATLEYTVSGTPELKPKWYKDGRPLVASKKYRISFKNNIAQLKFYSAELHDSGQYTFEISNEVGSSSCETTFTVLGQCFLENYSISLKKKKLIKLPKDEPLSPLPC